LIELQIDDPEVPKIVQSLDLSDHVVAEIERAQPGEGLEVGDVVDFEVAGGGEVEFLDLLGVGVGVS
jgi:hypothetical protein